MSTRNTRVSSLLVLVAVVALARTDLAAAQTPVPLSLDDAVRRALAEAPRIAEARARRAAAQSTVDARTAEGRPTLSAVAGFLRTNHVDEFGIRQADGSTRVLFPDIPSNYRARTELTVPLYTSGRVEARVDAARADEAAADADVRAIRADVELSTVATYWTLVTAHARATALARAVERADRVLSDVEARVAAGFLPPNDALSARAQRARQRVQLVQAESDVALAQAELARLVGVDLDQRIEPTTPVTRPTPGVDAIASQAAGELARRASATRADRLALSLRQRALLASADALFSAKRPVVGAVAAVEPARPNARFVPRTDQWHVGWDAGVTVTWSIFDSGRSRAERAAVLSQAEAIVARLADFDTGVAVEIRQRLLEITSNRAAIEAATEGVTAAAEARRVVGERFAVGVIASTEVLESDVALLEAELDRTRLEAALRIAEARLVRAVGGQ